MSRQLKRKIVIPEASRKLRTVSINGLVLAIALLATGCRGSTLPTETEASTQPTTLPAATMSDLPLAEIPPGQYLRFGHLTTEDGLSNNIA